jgi:hypothetical protein
MHCSASATQHEFHVRRELGVWGITQYSILRCVMSFFSEFAGTFYG